MKWTIHEDTVLVEGKRKKRTYAQIAKDFLNGPKCNNRNMESIRSRLTLSHFNKEKVNGRKNGKREDV
jgi:hypothetical protein